MVNHRNLRELWPEAQTGAAREYGRRHHRLVLAAPLTMAAALLAGIVTGVVWLAHHFHQLVATARSWVPHDWMLWAVGAGFVAVVIYMLSRWFDSDRRELRRFR